MMGEPHCRTCLLKLFSADMRMLGPMEVFKLVEDLRSPLNREMFLSELEKFCLYSTMPEPLQSSGRDGGGPLSPNTKQQFGASSPVARSTDRAVSTVVPAVLNNGTTLVVIRRESYEMLVDVLRVYLRQANNAGEFIQITHVYELAQRIGVNLCYESVAASEGRKGHGTLTGSSNGTGALKLSASSSILKRLSIGGHKAGGNNPTGAEATTDNPPSIDSYHVHCEQSAVLPLLPALVEHETWSNALLWLDCVDRLLMSDLKQVAAMRLTGTIPVLESFFRLDVKTLIFVLVCNRIQSVAGLLERHEAVGGAGDSAGASTPTAFLNGTKMLFHLPMWLTPAEEIHQGSPTISFADLLSGLKLRPEFCFWLLDTCVKFFIAGVTVEQKRSGANKESSAAGATGSNNSNITGGGFRDVNSNNGCYSVYNDVFSVGFCPAQELILAVCRYVQRIQYGPELKDALVNSLDADEEEEEQEQPEDVSVSGHRRTMSDNSSTAGVTVDRTIAGSRGSARLSLSSVSSFFGHRRRDSSAPVEGVVDEADSIGDKRAPVRVCLCCKRAMSAFKERYTAGERGTGSDSLPVYQTTSIPCTTWVAIGAPAVPKQSQLALKLNRQRTQYYPSVVCEHCFRLILMQSSGGHSSSGDEDKTASHAETAEESDAEAGLTPVVCVGACVVPVPEAESAHYAESGSNGSAALGDDTGSDGGSSALGEYCFLEEEPEVYSLLSLYDFQAGPGAPRLPEDTPVDQEGISACVDTILDNYQLTVSNAPFMPEYAVKPSSFYSDAASVSEDDSFYLEGESDGGLAMDAETLSAASDDGTGSHSEVVFKDVLLQYADSLDEEEGGDDENEFVLDFPTAGAGELTPTLEVPTLTKQNSIRKSSPTGTSSTADGTSSGPTALTLPPALEAFKTQFVTKGILIEKVCGQDLTNLKSRQLYIDKDLDMLFWTDKGSGKSRLTLSFFRSSKTSGAPNEGQEHSLKIAEITAIKEGHGDYAAYISVYTSNAHRKCLILVVNDKREYTLLLRLLAVLVRTKRAGQAAIES